jgi:hypothetical protein
MSTKRRAWLTAYQLKSVLCNVLCSHAQTNALTMAPERGSGGGVHTKENQRPKGRLFQRLHGSLD